MSTSTNRNTRQRYEEPTCRAYSAATTRAELREAHRYKMKRKKEERQQPVETAIAREVAEHNRKGELRHALGNHWRSRDGRKRTAPPRLSIWPEGKVAKPGRMA